MRVRSNDPAVQARIRSEIALVAQRIHAENLRAWARTNDGPYPVMEDAIAQARTEVQLLVAGIGWLLALTPEQLGKDQAAHDGKKHNPYRRGEPMPRPWERD